MFGIFRRKSLEDYLSETKKIKVGGVIFTIKKIDPIAHLQGINILKKSYDIYKLSKDDKSEALNRSEDVIKNIQKACREILLAGVVKPKLRAKADGGGVHVDELLKDVHMAQAVAEKILSHTYKKKMKM